MRSGDLLASGQETVTGTIERVAFHNPENDWSVLRVKLSDPPMREPQTVVGHTHAQPGQDITAKGAWRTDPSWGRQFAAASIVAATPTGIEGIARYLGSGMIPGIGPAAARLIVNAFGEDTLQVLDNAPERLLEIRGIGRKKQQRIAAGWTEQKAVSEIMLFLSEQQIPPYLCKRIYKRYEGKAIEVLREDPYRLALEVSGIGFKSADAIAHKFNIPLNSLQRVRAALVFLMQEESGSGSCGIARDDLLAKAMELLGVAKPIIEQGLAFDLGLSGAHDAPADRAMLVEHDGVIYLASLASAEESIASRLAQMATERPRWTLDVNAEVDAAQYHLRVTLAAQQRAAVVMMLTNKVSVMTGGPGVGKTATLKVLLHILRQRGLTVALAAPTGKAAQRATEATGVTATTLHRLLGLKPGAPASTKIETDALIIDEASMLDVPLTSIVIRALSSLTALIFVGDVDQLPSVGPGQVLNDLIRSQRIPVTRLTEVFRQAAGSLIIRNAHFINQGELPVKGEASDDFFVMAMPEKNAAGERIEVGTLAQSVVATVADLVATRLPARYGFDPFADIMVLSPMNGTISGVANLNSVIQKRLNPSPAKFVERAGIRFGVGDRVIQTRNNYDLDIFNGDTGRILDIDTEDKNVLLDFGGNEVRMGFDDMDELRLAYATTIHKAQGSQSPAVVIPVTTQHYAMLQRKLLYTGVTRASRLVVLVGMWRAIGIAVANDRDVQRVTRLSHLLSTHQRFHPSARAA